MDGLAFVFPGQGSQKMGMLTPFLAHEALLRPWFEQASDLLHEDLWALAQTGPEAKLNDTCWTQPVLLVAGVALWHAYCATDKPQPHFLSGHSLGEYTALVAARALSFEAAVRLVHLRGQLMQAAVLPGEGLMAAILGLDDQKVIALCEEMGGIVSAANFNSPGQVVIAGEKLAVEKASEACKAAGAKKVVILPVSIPSHCALMAPAAEKFREALADISLQMPTIPVMQNVNAGFAESVESLRTNLIEQLYSPVLWTQIIHRLFDAGVTRFVECGPGKVLTAMSKRIVREAEFMTIETLL